MTIIGGITREGRSVFMILVLDVGNTNIVMGVYDNARLVEHWRIATDREKTADEYGILLNNLFEHSPVKKTDIETVVISSVVPPVMPTLERMCAEYLNQSPLVVGPGIKTGIFIKYDNPKEVGADRIVNAVAAYEKYSGPLIIVDFGTATTFCAVSRAGEYLGGAIAPGIGISTEALFSRAAKLPRIELVKPRNVICKNTVSSMQSGIIYGFVGQVDYIVQKMAQEMAQDIGDKPKVVATGGLADLIFQESSSLDIVDPYLTLEGLRIIYQRNRDAKKV